MEVKVKFITTWRFTLFILGVILGLLALFGLVLLVAKLIDKIKRK